MKVSLEWLRQYVEYEAPAQEWGRILTEAGFALDGCEQVGEDWVLALDVCSNRPDCLGHIGLAREVAAVTGAAFGLPSVEFAEVGKPVDQWTRVDDEEGGLCGRYTARVIDGVQVGASPEWMVRRLGAVGVRSISNVVDITNYLLLEVGQPLHSFDYGQLAGGRIVVRRARPGEQMEMIDHSKIELSDDMLVIADAEKPVALAGVMGGLASEVGEHTRTVLLESAHFDPLSVRRTSRALGLGSESSFRFERNVDIVMVEWASRRAAALLAEWAGGKVAPGVVDVWPQSYEAKEVTMRLGRLMAVVGIEIEKEFVMTVLGRLGYAPRLAGEQVVCRVPSWRRVDVAREADLIEEVIRIYGYDKVPTESKIEIEVTTRDAYQRTRSKVAGILHGSGYYETVNVGFVEDRHWQAVSEEGFEPVRVKDLSRKSNNALRHSVLASLLGVRKRNRDAGNGRCDLYELAAVHRPARQGKLPEEAIMLGLLTDGDFQELRGVAEGVVAGVDKRAKLRCEPGEVVWADQGKGAVMKVGDRVIGQAGQGSAKVMEAFDLQEAVCLAEIRFEELLKMEGGVYALEPLLRYPGVTRDLSLVLEEAVAWAAIEKAIEQEGIGDLRQVEFVGIFRGKGLEKGKKSLTLSMHFRRVQETLTHEQVDEYQRKILGRLEREFGAELRGA